MFGTYLRRELKNRRRQTSIIAIGMALAIALVILVNALAGGVQNAHASAPQSVYGGGPSSFGVTSTSVLGYDTASTSGPISSTTLTSGRLLTAGDAGTARVVLDKDYATSASKKVGSTVSLGGKTFTVVGIVQSTS